MGVVMEVGPFASEEGGVVVVVVVSKPTPSSYLQVRGGWVLGLVVIKIKIKNYIKKNVPMAQTTPWASIGLCWL
jgi:hypothetical protein